MPPVSGQVAVSGVTLRRGRFLGSGEEREAGLNRHTSTRDGIHLGVMREHGIQEVLSYDRGLSQVPWVKRLEA
jgi:predicted nucleic acid-binding protein